MVYQWKKSPFNKHGVDAQVAGEFLEKLRAERGLRADVVVDAARNPDCPLHPVFEWDDKRAADLHRKETARTLIQNIAVRIERNGELSEPVRAFITLTQSHPSDDEYTQYHSIIDVTNDPEQRKLMLQRALDELNQWRQRYAELQEFVKLFTYVDTLMMKVSEHTEAARASA